MIANRESLHSYCNDWKLKVNSSKTKIVVFSRGMVHTDNFDFKFDREAIAVVNEYKYLGITFNCNGRFRRGELELVEQANELCINYLLPAVS